MLTTMAMLIACTPEPEPPVVYRFPGPAAPMGQAGDTGGEDTGATDGDTGGDTGHGDGWVAYEHTCGDDWSGIGTGYWHVFPVEIEAGTMPPEMELWGWWTDEYVAIYEDLQQEELAQYYLADAVSELDGFAAAWCDWGNGYGAYEGWLTGGWILVVAEE